MGRRIPKQAITGFKFQLEPEDKNDPDVHKVYEAGMHYIYSN